jgi:hypothetical protein
MKSGSGSDSTTASNSAGKPYSSLSGVRSRSLTIWKAGRAARIAGVMGLGSEGSSLAIDSLIS